MDKSVEIKTKGMGLYLIGLFGFTGYATKNTVYVDLPFYLANHEDATLIIAHELVHVGQIRRDGVFKFYFTYIKDFIYHYFKRGSWLEAYLSIPYERQAYELQRDASFYDIAKNLLQVAREKI